MKKILILIAASFIFQINFAQEVIHEDAIEVIKKHGMDQSEVLDIASWMTDVYGPRLTGSPMLDKATDWAIKTLESWGLQNIHKDEWGPFGRGWEMTNFNMAATSPNQFPIMAYPKAWSPAMQPTEAEVVIIDINDEEDLKKYEGKLAGKFVMIDTIRVLKEWFDAPAKRLDSEQLLNMANATPPRHGVYRNWRGRGGFGTALWEMLYKEKPIAVIDRSYKGDLGTIFVSGARTSGGVSARDEGVEVIPQVTMSAEHYNRIYRMINKGIPVKIKMELDAMYSNPDGMEHNIIAEIPGTDLKDEVVMFGAHFDSWHTGTGATDNAAGSSVMMEVARILQKTIAETGIQPRRTLRLALWTGEEQGLFGSRSYCKKNFAEVDNDGNQLRPNEASKKISAYYNLDNGTGRVRGVYLQGNDKVRNTFSSWLDPFKEMDASTLTISNTGGTDHLSFDRLNIPGFQFIQDPVAYSTRTHHSNMDNLDHLIEDDLKQAATIIASFVWHTAQRDAKLPRKEDNDKT